MSNLFRWGHLLLTTRGLFAAFIPLNHGNNNLGQKWTRKNSHIPCKHITKVMNQIRQPQIPVSLQGTTEASHIARKFSFSNWQVKNYFLFSSFLSQCYDLFFHLSQACKYIAGGMKSVSLFSTDSVQDLSFIQLINYFLAEKVRWEQEDCMTYQQVITF